MKTQDIYPIIEGFAALILEGMTREGFNNKCWKWGDMKKISIIGKHYEELRLNNDTSMPEWMVDVKLDNTPNTIHEMKLSTMVADTLRSLKVDLEKLEITRCRNLVQDNDLVKIFLAARPETIICTGISLTPSL